MFRRYLIAVLLLAASPLHALCTGEDQYNTLPPADIAEIEAIAATDRFGEGILWQATKGDSTITIVGTFHLHDPRHDAMMARLRPIMEQADLVFLEIAGQAKADFERSITRSPELIFITEGPTLIDRLSDEAWQMVAAALDRQGIPSFVGAKFQPWYLGTVLAIPPCAAQDLVAGKQGLDGLIENAAAEMRLPVLSLDVPAELLAMLSEGSIDEQVADLEAAIRLFGDISPDIGALPTTLNLYFSERNRLIWEFSKKYAERRAAGKEQQVKEIFGEVETELLAERNAKWAPIILQQAAGKTALIGVGSAHLTGDDGILALLEEAGYSLKRLPLSAP